MTKVLEHVRVTDEIHELRLIAVDRINSAKAMVLDSRGALQDPSAAVDSLEMAIDVLAHAVALLRVTKWPVAADKQPEPLPDTDAD